MWIIKTPKRNISQNCLNRVTNFKRLIDKKGMNKLKINR